LLDRGIEGVRTHASAIHPVRLTVLAGVACLPRAIVREAAAQRAPARRLPSPERRGANASRIRPAGRKVTR